MSSLISSLSEIPPSNGDVDVEVAEGKGNNRRAATSEENQPYNAPVNCGDDEEELPTTPLSQRRRMIKRQSVQEGICGLEDFTLAFERLSVHVPAVKRNCCSRLFCRGATCCACLSNFGTEYLGWSVERTDAFYALQNVSGHVSTGEMVLVLGSDPQYSSALIQSLTGRLAGETDISGTVSFNGKNLFYRSPAELQGWRQISAHVAAGDASHSPVLTVRETFRFAAECTNTVTNAASRKEKLDDLVNEVLEALDLTHVADTAVGDENLRGVSGGQKRRVTVGEMLLAIPTRFLGLENITNGLSSKDSLSIIERIQQVCQTFRKAAVISLLQPSDEIVALFDKLLVLTSDGNCAYFGPIDRTLIREIFMGKDASPKKDVGSLCDLVLGTSDQDKEQGIVQRFHQSAACATLQQDLQEHLHPEMRGGELKTYLPKIKYSSSWQHQLKVISSRRMKMIVRNPSTYFRIMIACGFGLIIGSLFSVLKFDFGGSMARQAFLFQSCFLVLLLSTGITVPQLMRERVTLYKHRSAEFYSSRVAYITQAIFDLPLSLLEAVILASIPYWWVNLNPLPERYFYFLGVLIAMEFVGLALARFLCAISPNQVFAKSVTSILTLLFSTIAGFMPKYHQIPWVLRWISWITPASYAFEGLTINEFVGRELHLAYISDGNETTTKGDLTGEDWLDINGIPRVEWGPLGTIKIFDLIFLFIIALLLDVLGCILIERNRESYFNQIRQSQRITKSQDFEEESSSKPQRPPPSPDTTTKMQSTNTWPNTLSIKDVSYYVPLKRDVHCTVDSILSCVLGNKKGAVEEMPSKELQLLSSVTARFTCGRMCALMGTSGAGKTTLLDVIAGYKTGGRITGDIFIDGVPKDPRIWKLMSGYAEQNDILNPYLSVVETLRFTATCRLGKTTNQTGIIDNVIRLMEIEEWLDYVIGHEKGEGGAEGIPKHVRKRLTIAIQLVMLPRILFLDEPTTGLGTAAANLVIQSIRRSTSEMNLITVATIHQPSRLIWDAFDDLLLLVKGGRVAYMGEMGENSSLVIGHFSALSSTEPSASTNPADFVISAVTRVTPEEAAASFKKSDAHSRFMIMEKEGEKLGSSDHQTDMLKLRDENKRNHSGLREFYLLTKRHFLTQVRNPSYSLVRLASSGLLSFYFGVLFFADKSDIEGAILTIGGTFFLIFVLVVPMQAAVVPLVEDRAVLYREATSGLYSRWSYGLGQLASDIPFHIVNTIVMFFAYYFLIGFQRGDGHMAYFILMIFLINWVFTSIGQLYAVACPNEESANGLAGLSVILSVIFMGFLIGVDAMPFYWQWAYWADILHYVVQGLTSNEMAGKRYSLFPGGSPPTDGMTGRNASLIGSLDQFDSSTSGFFFPTGTDLSDGCVANSSGLSDGCVANQESNLVSLIQQATPGRNESWDSSGLISLYALIDCLVLNECLVDPLATNLLLCINNPVRRMEAPCEKQWKNATEDVDGSRLRKCLGSASRNDATNMMNIVLCLVSNLVPRGPRIDFIKNIVAIFDDLFGIVMVVVDFLIEGIPGEVILWFFGWAYYDEEKGELVAPYKWYYSMTAVAVFVVGIEIIKLFAIRYVVWTKR